MFWCKQFRVKDELVVAICDEDIIGKEIKKNPKIEVKKNFYRGELVDEDGALKAMNKSTIGNLMGKNIIKLALQKKFITKENVMIIGGVPHAQYIQ